MAEWYKDKKGYRYFSDSGRQVSRWSAEKRIGRPLRQGEVVHHINRNKGDNRPGNLWIFKDQRAHDRAHRKDNWY